MTPEEKSIAYWDARPCNSRHSNLEPGTKEYILEVRAKRYKAETHILGFLPGKPFFQKVLEVGCGIGADAVTMSQWRHKVTAVDASKRSCEMAAKHLDPYGAPVIHSTLEKLSTKLGANGQFDCIYSFGAIHHMECPAYALHLLKYYLRPEGELRIMLYHRWSWKSGMILLKNFWRLKSPRRLIADYSEAQPGCPITHTFTVRQARKLVNAHFDVQSIEVAHIFPYRVKDYVQGKYVLAFPWNILPERFRLWLAGYIGWHLLIIARPKTP